MKKLKKILLWMVSLLFLGFFIAGIGIGNYFYNLALDPQTDKSAIFEAPHNQFQTVGGKPWLDSVPYQTVQLTSDDDLKLTAYQVHQEQDTNHYAILVHGYTSDAKQMGYYASHFYDAGYHLLIPDARGHGESEGHYIGMGWHERYDLLNWIEKIIAEDEDAKIVLFGVSMGGATVLSTSGEKLPKQVKAIISDCGYSSVKEIFAYQLDALFGLPAFPILNFSSLVSYFRAGYALGEAAMIDQVAHSKTPLLFIHGDQDDFVPYEMVYQVYEAAQVEKELFIVEGAGHSEAAQIAGEEYWDTVFNFIDPLLSTDEI